MRVSAFTRYLLAALLFVLASAVSAQQESLEALEFASAEKKSLYYRLTQEFRCLQCQNQNLAGSAAGLADDLKAQVYEMVEAGRTADEIKSYMVERYGDFILYRPALKPLTLLLWIMPFVLLVGGLFFVYRLSRSKSTENPVAVDTSSDNVADAAALQRARDLLGND